MEPPLAILLKGAMRYMSKYLTIAEDFERKIQDHLLLPGTQLPTEKDLMQEYAVSRQTVRNAMTYLAKKNLINRRKGSGSFVAKPNTSGDCPKNIAVLITSMDNYIFPFKSAGINSVLSDNGYVSNFFLTNNQIDKEESAIRTILSSNFYGVIMETSRAVIPRGNDLLKTLDQSLPVILMDGHYPQFPEIPFVSLDDMKGGYKATEYLIQNGQKDIFHVGKIDDIQGHLRYQGYVKALNDYQLPFSENNVFWISEEQYDNIPPFQLDVICDRIEKCTAVFFYNDYIASAILPQLIQRGMKIPSDLSVVSYDNSPLVTVEPFPLTSIRHPLDEIGRTAASQLLKRINNRSENATFIFEPELVEHNSVRQIG